MKIFLDTEYNGHGGALIAMALVPASDAYGFFYESLGCDAPCAWVAENVMPVIGIPPVSEDIFRLKLHDFLDHFVEDDLTIVASWHEDIIHFCEMLSLEPGRRMGPSDIRFEIRSVLQQAQSDIPHQAYADAVAMRRLAAGF